MDQFEVSGELTFGVTVEGREHRTFRLRASTVADALKAEASIFGKKGNRHFQTALLAEQLLELGTLPKKEITTSILSRLYMVDWVTLVEADNSLDLQIRSFRGQDSGAEEGNSSAGAQDGVE